MIMEMHHGCEEVDPFDTPQEKEEVVNGDRHQ